jgi:hypothetical protein
MVADVIDRTIRYYGSSLSDSQRNLLQAAFNDCGRGDYDAAFSFARTAVIDLHRLDLKADGLTLFALQRQLDILRSMRAVEISLPTANI